MQPKCHKQGLWLAMQASPAASAFGEREEAPATPTVAVMIASALLFVFLVPFRLVAALFTAVVGSSAITPEQVWVSGGGAWRALHHTFHARKSPYR